MCVCSSKTKPPDHDCGYTYGGQLLCYFNLLRTARFSTDQPLQAPNNRMQPAYFGTYKTVAVPFGSQAIELPREHRLVKNGSFVDRFVEGTYLRSIVTPPHLASGCSEWPRTDHLVIVWLKVRNSLVTLPHLASGCSA